MKPLCTPSLDRPSGDVNAKAGQFRGAFHGENASVIVHTHLAIMAVMGRSALIVLVAMLATVVACGDEQGGDASSAAGGSSSGSGAGPAGGDSTGTGASGGSSGARHDFCADVGTSFGMGAAIFGDPGTAWFQQAGVDWTYGYMYASGDPQQDLSGFTYLVNYRLDSAEQAGATIPTVTFYRMLDVGNEHGHSGSEAQIVQSMLTDPAAVADYLDDFIAVLDILATRATPTLLHVEPDSWGFMMWAFDGVDPNAGNGDATAIPVALAAANHPALAGQAFPDDAGGLGHALLYLRDHHAPEVRMGWHASNFRVGTRPDIVTGFYSALGAWDVIVTEPPHMNGSGTAAWDPNDGDNANNLDWLANVSATTQLPILIWQTYVDDADAYLGAWPSDQSNIRRSPRTAWWACCGIPTATAAIAVTRAPAPTACTAT